MSRSFKYVQGYDEKYKVSSYGEVVRNPYTVIRKNYSYIAKEKVVKWHLNKDGYKRINLLAGDRIDLHLVHVLVAEAFLGPRPDGMFVDHKDRVRTNNHISNLRYVTRSENNSGGKVGIGNRLKLKEDDVISIKIMLSKGMSRVEIASLFNVSRQTINDIAWGRTWTKVKIFVNN